MLNLFTKANSAVSFVLMAGAVMGVLYLGYMRYSSVVAANAKQAQEISNLEGTVKYLQDIQAKAASVAPIRGSGDAVARMQHYLDARSGH